MAEPFAKFLRNQLQQRGWEVNTLVEKTKVSRQAISRHLNGHNFPGRATRRLYAIALGYQGVDDFDRQWMSPKTPKRNKEAETLGVPVFDQVPAGVGDYDPVVMGQDDGRADWYIPRPMLPDGADDPDAYAVRVKGDSMAPDFNEGEIVVASPAAPHEDGMVAVFRLSDGSCGLKFYEAAGEDDVLLVPRNPSYTPRRVPREEVVRLARVVAHIRPTAHTRHA